MTLETPAPPSDPSSQEEQKEHRQREDSPQADESLLVWGLGLAGRGGRLDCWRPAGLLFLLHTILSL